MTWKAKEKSMSTRRKKKKELQSPYREFMEVLFRRCEVISFMKKKGIIKDRNAGYLLHPDVIEIEKNFTVRD